MSLSTTTLTQALNTTERQVYLASLTGIVVGRILGIDNELMHVTSIGPAKTVYVQRGTDGTGAASHALNATVSIGTPTDFAGAAPPGSSPTGSDGQVQFNTLGALTGDARFVWNATQHGLGVGSGASSGPATSGVELHVGPAPATLPAQFFLPWEHQILTQDGVVGNKGLFVGASDTTGANRASGLTAKAITTASSGEARGLEVTTYTNAPSASMTAVRAQVSNLSASQAADGTGVSILAPSNAGGGWSSLVGLNIDNHGATSFAIVTGTGIVSFGDIVRMKAFTFAQLPASPVAGTMAYVSDSTVNTWGTTIAGGGANKVLAFFNGTAWTVAGK